MDGLCRAKTGAYIRLTPIKELGQLMRRCLYFSMLFLLIGTFSLGASTMNIVVNGSFELPALNFGTWNTFDAIPGWSHVTPGPGIEVQNNVAGSPYDGFQFVELDSTALAGFPESSIYQDLATTPGTEYILTFAFSARPTVAENIMGVSWGGSPVTTVSANGSLLTNTDWQVYRFAVTASSNSTRLQFSGLGHPDNVGEYLDAVSVTSPEPTSALLCLGGLLVAVGKCRKHAASRS
jgi:hypothetical protein